MAETKAKFYTVKGATIRFNAVNGKENDFTGKTEYFLDVELAQPLNWYVKKDGSPKAYQDKQGRTRAKFRVSKSFIEKNKDASYWEAGTICDLKIIQTEYMNSPVYTCYNWDNIAGTKWEPKQEEPEEKLPWE